MQMVCWEHQRFYSAAMNQIVPVDNCRAHTWRCFQCYRPPWRLWSASEKEAVGQCALYITINFDCSLGIEVDYLIDQKEKSAAVLPSMLANMA